MKHVFVKKMQKIIVSEYPKDENNKQGLNKLDYFKWHLRVAIKLCYQIGVFKPILISIRQKWLKMTI